MVEASRASHVRRSNLALVLDRLRTGGPQSRSHLVSATGLTRSAIAGLVTELVSLGLVVESPPEPDGTPGRPSPIARVDDRHVGALAIEVFVDEIGASIVALDGSIVSSIRRPRGRRGSSVANTVREVVTLVRRLDAQQRTGAGPGPVRRIVGVGVSVPGLVRESDNTVVVAPNLGWVEVDLAGPLAAALGNDLPIRVGNDADLGALAESRFGAGVGTSHLLFVSGEVGVGGGVVIDGRPLAGESGFAAEIGHVPVNPAGQSCRCGGLGCWETEVGEHALLRRAGLPVEGGSVAVGRLLAMADAGDAAALAALDEEAEWLAVGLTGLMNVLDPDRVVLGGLLARLLPYVADRLDAELDRRRFRHAARNVEVIGAALGEQSTTVGAAELAFGPLLRDPAAADQLGNA